MGMVCSQNAISGSQNAAIELFCFFKVALRFKGFAEVVTDRLRVVDYAA
jgi:hypothetical protein